MEALGAGQAIDMSRFPFGDHFDDLQTDELFYRFLQAYMRLASFLLLADTSTYSRDRVPRIVYPLPSAEPEAHIRHLHSILRAEKAPVFHLLHKDYGADTREMSIRLHKDFLLGQWCSKSSPA